MSAEVSQHANVKLHDVATVLVAAGSGAEPGPEDPALVSAVLEEFRRTVLGAGFADPPGDAVPGWCQWFSRLVSVAVGCPR